MSILPDTNFRGPRPVFFHERAFAMRRALERVRKLTLEQQQQEGFSAFDKEVERILPTTRFTGDPEEGIATDKESDKYHIGTRPYHWMARKKTRWVLDSDLGFRERELNGIPGGPIESSFSVSQVQLRRRILVNADSYSAAAWRFKLWLKSGRPWNFWPVADELHSSYLFFHPADCLTYFYRHERNRKVLGGEELSFVIYLYLNELKVINRWKFYEKSEAPIVDEELQRRALIQQVLRGLATRKFIQLTQERRVAFTPFIVFELGKYTFPEQEIFDITRLIEFRNKHQISAADFQKSVDLHCRMLSLGERPLCTEELFQRLGVRYGF